MLKEIYGDSMDDAVIEQESQVSEPTARKAKPSAPPQFDGAVQCDPIVIRFQLEDDEDDFDDFDDEDFDDDFDDDFEEVSEDDMFDDLDEDLSDDDVDEDDDFDDEK